MYLQLQHLAPAKRRKMIRHLLLQRENQWDGRYRMEGTMTDHSNPANGWMNNTYEYTLQTSGTNTDSLVSNSLGFPGIIIGNTGAGITNATFYGKVWIDYDF